MHKSGGLYRTGTGAATVFRSLMPSKIGAWTKCRTAPKLAANTLHQQVKARGKNKGEK